MSSGTKPTVQGCVEKARESERVVRGMALSFLAVVGMAVTFVDPALAQACANNAIGMAAWVRQEIYTLVPVVVTLAAVLGILLKALIFRSWGNALIGAAVFMIIGVVAFFSLARGAEAYAPEGMSFTGGCSPGGGGGGNSLLFLFTLGVRGVGESIRERVPIVGRGESE